MDWMQFFIVVTGLAGQILVAKRNPAGFFCWIAGNMAMMVMFAEQSLYAMVGLYCIYTLISMYGIFEWRAGRLAPQPAATASRA